MTPNHMHGRKRHSLTNKGKDQYHVGKVTRSKRRRLRQWSGRVQIMQVIHEDAERQAQLTPNICDFKRPSECCFKISKKSEMFYTAIHTH